VIAFGTAVTSDEIYDRYAAPGIERAAEPDSVVLAHRSTESLFRNYNALLDRAKAYEDLEALVLLHQDVELADQDFAVRIREALSDPDVAIVGCVGAVGVRGLGWWQGALTWASMTHRYPEHGGGEFPAISWRSDFPPSSVEPGEVDSIDGFVMVLSPWAVRELRFDQSLGSFHGYDYDMCMQARAAGKKVVTARFRAIHHHSLELIDDPEVWIQTYVRLAEKWDGRLPDTGADPERRAVRAEAEAACERALRVSHQMREEAVKRELARRDQELESTRDQLESMRRDLAATHRELRAVTAGADHGSDAEVTEGGPSAVPPGKARAIDYAVEHLVVDSFASLEAGQTYGQYAFYGIERPEVRAGALVHVGSPPPAARLLNVIDHAAEHDGLRVLDGGFADPRTATEIGDVGAVLLFDVLMRMVDPDWDRVLDLYAPATSCFVISNPQWTRGETTVRLIDLGRERYLEAVPPWAPHLELFDRLDEWQADQARWFRETAEVWQWGITDADLQTKMRDLGFSLDREWELHPIPDTEGFVNKAFVFRRSNGT
jgi:Glycosyltransferase like family